MASSSSSVESDDEGFLASDLTVLLGRVKLLRTFHQCARKWGNDVVDDDDDASDLAGLLVRIEDVASELESEAEQAVSRTYYELQPRIDFFKQEINHWYIKFSDWSRQSSSSSQNQDMTSDEILEFIDYSLFGCFDILIKESYFFGLRSLDYDLLHLLYSLKEKIKFLRNFIRFTTLQLGSIIINIDDDRRGCLGNLLTHIRAVAISAAHYSYMCQFGQRDPVNVEMEFKISQLLQKIKPVDPQVYKTYVQILESLSKQPSAKATLIRDENVSRDFIASLLSYLFEILKADKIPVFSSKDQLQILRGGLRGLRYILYSQTEKFDKNTWELTREVVCDAGIVIFSLFLDSIEDGLAKRMNFMPSDLLERIKRIAATVAVESPQGSVFNFANVDGLRLVDFLLENLAGLTNREAGSAAIPNLQIQKIYEGLAYLRPFLGKILELHDQKEELQALWSRVLELAQKAEFLVDSLAIGDIADSSVTLFDSFDSIVEEMNIIKLDASKIFDEAGFDVESTKVAERSDHFSLERSIPIIKEEIVGFHDEATSIKNQLVRGEGKLQIVAIVGMPGSEKILKKFPNLRKLKADVDADASDEETDSVLALDCLRQLESLNLTSYTALQVEFSFPLNLKKLTLQGIELPWCKMSAIGNLSKLEVLKLRCHAFEGEIWNMDEAMQLPSLKFLKLENLDIVKWTTSKSVQEHFPCLVKLILKWCNHLEEVPSCLGDSFHLQTIEVYNCHSSVEDSVKRIQEEQQSMGNEDLKVLIHRSRIP